MVRDPREIQNLFIEADVARFVGMPFPTRNQRMVLCRDLAAAMHLVHRNNLIFGDFNARNAVFRLQERPSIMLVDCDAIRIKGNIGVQLNAPDWDPPEGRQAASQYSDRYKLGLFMLRCLTPGVGGSTARDPVRADAALDFEGRKLLRAALNGRREQRPTAQDWGRYWDELINGHSILSAAGPTGARQPPLGRRDADDQRAEVDLTDPTLTPAVPAAQKPATVARLRRGSDGKWYPAQ